jgi:3-hydroxyacyl-[acyl-carrier-protein] dehydratase
MEIAFHHAGTLFFDPEDRIYMDHFPGNPVVPGSVIIHAFLRVHGGLAHPGNPVQAENFRFKHFVSPGEYQYEMTKNDNVIRCRLFDKSLMLVTGNLVL